MHGANPSSMRASFLARAVRPKKPGTIMIDKGRILRHIVPLIGKRKVREVAKADVNKALRDVMADEITNVVKN